MHFEWDDEKAKRNVDKHSFSFSQAVAIFADPDHVVLDTIRSADGEHRRKAIGRIGARLYTVVFVTREGTCRLISARRANVPEERTYDTRDFGSR